MTKRKYLYIALVLTLLAAGVALGYFYMRYQRVKGNPDYYAQLESKNISEKIGKFMELPKGELPEVSTVVDVTKLSNNELFTNAQNGDKLLVYNTAGIILLYRPSVNKIIAYSGSKKVSYIQEPPTTIAIYNGTAINGLASTYEDKLSSVTNIIIQEKKNASLENYTKSYVLDISGTHKEMAQKITEAIGGELLDKLPEGEISPKTDILIIAGK